MTDLVMVLAVVFVCGIAPALILMWPYERRRR